MSSRSGFQSGDNIHFPVTRQAAFPRLKRSERRSRQKSKWTAALRQFGRTVNHGADALLAMLADAQLMDSERSRRWTAELVKFAIQKDGK